MKSIPLGRNVVAFEIQSASDRLGRFSDVELRELGWSEDAISRYMANAKAADTLRTFETRMGSAQAVLDKLLGRKIA